MGRFIQRVASLTAVAVLATAVPLSPLPSAFAADVVTAGVTGGNLRSVAFVSATTGFAAADNGVIMKTTDGGESWTQVRAADSYSFRGIDFWDANNGAAVDSSGKVAKTTDGGATWANVDFYPYADMDGAEVNSRTHNDVACLEGGTNAITAAGSLVPGDTDAGGATSMRTTGNLQYWSNPLIPTKPHLWYNTGSLEWEAVGTGEFLDIEYVGSTTVWASGIDYWGLWNEQNTEKYPLFKSTDGGVTYTKIPGFGQTHLRFDGVAFGSATAGVVVGQVVGGTRRVHYTSNGGTTWIPATFPGTSQLNAVDMSSAANGWAVGADGGIIRTTNGGVNWTDCTITGGNSYELHDVEFIPGTTTGWAVGNAGTVLLTTDGVTWRAPIPPDTTPPAAPTGLTATATGQATIGLSWSAASDPSGIAKYTVYTQAGAKVADVSGTTTSYTVTGLSPSTSYGYQVTATDGSSNANQSAKSAVASATTLAAPDTTPPAAPTGLTATATGQTTIGLSWSAASDPTGIAKYTVYTQAGAKVADVSGTTTSYTVTGLSPSTSYGYQVTATDGSVNANQSAKSAVASATTLAAPPAPPALMPVYRFYNFTNGTHFFTPSATERDIVIAKWPNVFTYEGVAYSVNPANNTQPLYRFYNAGSGSHFYTASSTERDTVIARWPHIFTYEGETYNVSSWSVPNSMAVYRFYNVRNGSHFFTSSATERDTVIAKWPHVYTYEGAVFWLGQ